MLRLCEKGRVVEEWNDVVIEEMRIVRALTNDNLLKVYGAVLEPLRLAIVNEYCSKGTLQVAQMLKSLIQNEEKKQK